MPNQMKAIAKPRADFFSEFKRRIKKETFSFMGLSLSLFVLIMNVLTNNIVPAHESKIVNGIIEQSTTISSAYWAFTIGLLLLSLLFLYSFLKPDKFNI